MARLGPPAALLAFQLFMIGYARFEPGRYYCWAPHDAQNQYRIDIQVAGRHLSQQEVRSRYRMPHYGWDPRSIEHVKRVIRQYERTYGRSDAAQVTLVYTINGGTEQRWRWPER